MKSLHMLFAAAVAIAAVAGVLPPPAQAHHSGAGFDQTKVVEITGTIKEFQFKNPHTWIQVDVDDPAKGAKVEWSVEWGSPNQLGRQGYRPTTFPPGETVTIRLNPMHNGSPAGGFVGAKFPDGKTVGKWD
jgi:hypothetical protein